jgi:hypothetical protein
MCRVLHFGDVLRFEKGRQAVKDTEKITKKKSIWALIWESMTKTGGCCGSGGDCCGSSGKKPDVPKHEPLAKK